MKIYQFLFIAHYTRNDKKYTLPFYVCSYSDAYQFIGDWLDKHGGTLTALEHAYEGVTVRGGAKLCPVIEVRNDKPYNVKNPPGNLLPPQGQELKKRVTQLIG